MKRILFVLALALAACGDNASTPAGVTASGSGGASGTTSTGKGVTSAGATTSNVGPSAGSGSDGGLFCGGFQVFPCPKGMYCDRPDDECGEGMCQKRPITCLEASPVAVCGCNGDIYGSACAAATVGADVDAKGTCKLPAGAFTCGTKVCKASQEYCVHTLSEGGDKPDTWACAALPAACAPPATPDCACLSGVPCGSCSVGASGELVATCGGADAGSDADAD